MNKGYFPNSNIYIYIYKNFSYPMSLKKEHTWLSYYLLFIFIVLIVLLNREGRLGT